MRSRAERTGRASSNRVCRLSSPNPHYGWFFTVITWLLYVVPPLKRTKKKKILASIKVSNTKVHPSTFKFPVYFL